MPMVSISAKVEVDARLKTLEIVMDASPGMAFGIRPVEDSLRSPQNVARHS